jgi:hypothetical protein
VIEFYSLGVAASYLLYMRNLGYHLDAIQEWPDIKKGVRAVGIPSKQIDRHVETKKSETISKF